MNLIILTTLMKIQKQFLPKALIDTTRVHSTIGLTDGTAGPFAGAALLVVSVKPAATGRFGDRRIL